jgi:tetratricopeptide (TPR) repeat protein
LPKPTNLSSRSYTIALRHCATENEKPALHQNRAIANLRLDIFDAALADASRSSLEAELPEKAQYRAAMALYGLSRYDECRERLEALLNRYPDNPAAREKLLAVEQRLREQQTGEYDFKAMQEQVRAGRRHLDIATYSKPVIVKEAPGKGRGLFTTEAVKAGTLLLCEKAFAYGAAADDESGGVLITAGSGSISLLMNKPTKDVIAGMQPAVISSVVQKMFRNPSLAPTITDLDCGSYEPVKDAGLVDGQLVVDR